MALSGAVGECEAFGQAKGAQQDFADLQDIFDRVQPPLTPAEQQAATRRACLNAYGVLYGKRSRKNDAAVAAVDAAMARGGTLGEVVRAQGAAKMAVSCWRKDTRVARLYSSAWVTQAGRARAARHSTKSRYLRPSCRARGRRPPDRPSASTRSIPHTLVRSRRGTPGDRRASSHRPGSH